MLMLVNVVDEKLRCITFGSNIKTWCKNRTILKTHHIKLLEHVLSHRAQAIAIGQALVDGRWLECVTHHDQIFRDEYALYRPLQVLVYFLESNTVQMLPLHPCVILKIFPFLSEHRVLRDSVPRHGQCDFSGGTLGTILVQRHKV